MPGSCRDLVSGNDDHSFGVMQTRQVDKATRLSKSETDHVAWWTRERLPQANVEGRLKTHPMAGFPNPTGGILSASFRTPDRFHGRKTLRPAPVYHPAPVQPVTQSHPFLCSFGTKKTTLDNGWPGWLCV